MIKGLENKDLQVKEISQDEKRYHLELDERITPHRGHKLFKVCEKSGRVSEAEYSSDLVWSIKLGKFVPENPTLVKEVGFKYVSALNKSNVEKKLEQGSNGSRIDWTKDRIQL